MSISTADIFESIHHVWDESGLTSIFKALWVGTERTDLYPALNDGEAQPNTPFPYCVLSLDNPDVRTRMTANVEGTKRELRTVPITFDVFASEVTGDERSSKAIAAYLVEEICKVFGGHPTVQPTDLSLSNGNVLIVQYVTDYSVNAEDQKYQWVLSYQLHVDVPVAV